MPRLDRFLGKTLAIKRGDARWLLARGRVTVDGIPATGIDQVIGRFSEVRLDDQVLQARTAHYLMLNKPAGVVSATRDAQHRTVIDLLEAPWKDELHIVGRLDLIATGMVLLTNDGHWSRALSLPQTKLPKRYRVTVQQPLTGAHVEAFQRGFYFAYEAAWTRPAQLQPLGEFEAEVTLIEGRYHQIRRMFGHLGNKVLAIHRVAVGAVTLDSGLAPGGSRALTESERAILAQHV